MDYIELYGNDILDVASLGKTSNEFNPENGDYVRIDVVVGDQGGSGNIQYSLYSNKILLRDIQNNTDYYGDYHIRPIQVFNDEQGVGVNTTAFYSGVTPRENENQVELKPVNDLDGSVLTGLSFPNTADNYKKHFKVYYDSNEEIYIKPNEIAKLLNISDGVNYNLKISFLNDVKNDIGSFLSSQNTNLIENGCFLAGLEATQTGDLDRSIGHNRFTRLPNPGPGNFVLEQNGYENNSYSMMVTGIEPNSNYVISGWVGFNSFYNSSPPPPMFNITADLSPGGIQNNVSNTSVFCTVSDASNIINPDNDVYDFKARFSLKGTEVQGVFPDVVILVNGIEIANLTINNTEYQWYEFDLPQLSVNAFEEIRFSVRFINDKGLGAIGDRNLFWNGLETFELKNGQQITPVKKFEFESTTGSPFTYMVFGDTTSPVDLSNTELIYNNLDGTPLEREDSAFPGHWKDAPSIFYNGEISAIFRNEAIPNVYSNEALNNIVNFIDESLIKGIDYNGLSGYGINYDKHSSFAEQFHQPEIVPGFESRNIQTITIGNNIFYQRFLCFSTTSEADLGTIMINLGKWAWNLGTPGLGNTMGPFSNTWVNTNPLGRRYYTGLRMEKIENFGSSLQDYFNKIQNGLNI